MGDVFSRLIASCFVPILQGASLQNGGGAITCAQVLPLLSLQERNVGNQEHVHRKQA